MKQMKRLLSLLLCAALLLGLAACQTEPVATEPTETEPPATEPAPTEPPAEEVYADARAAMEEKTGVTLNLSVVKTTTVAGQIFTEASEQVLTYANLGTDTVQVALEENISFNIHEEDEEDEDEEDAEEKPVYKEVYSDGIVYTDITMDTPYLFSAEVTAEECADRYLPVILLDGSLYGSLTSETEGGATTITFSEPTAAEAWAVPEEAELLEASGSAVVDESGALTQMNYTVTYQYGAAEIKLEVESKPQAETAEVTVPEDADSYILLQYADAMRTYLRTAGLLVQQIPSARVCWKAFTRRLPVWCAISPQT